MNNRVTTIQIFLPNGKPTGIRIAEITTSVLRVIEVPKTNCPVPLQSRP